MRQVGIVEINLAELPLAVQGFDGTPHDLVRVPADWRTPGDARQSEREEEEKQAERDDEFVFL